MTKSKKEIFFVGSEDDSSDSDAEVGVSSPSLHRDASAPHYRAIDLTDSKVSSETAPRQNESRTRHQHYDIDLTSTEHAEHIIDLTSFIDLPSTEQSSSANVASASATVRASASSDAQLIGTKRPRQPSSHSNNPTMNNHINNTGDLFGTLNGLHGFGRAGMASFNPAMGLYDQSAGPGRYGPIPGVNYLQNTHNIKKRKVKTNPKPVEDKPTAMMRGKSMQQPQGFDAIDMYYPHLRANDRTRVLQHLLSKCTHSDKSKQYVHNFRVKFEKANPKATLWALTKALSEELTRLEGESKMPARKQSLTDETQHKENKPNIDCSIRNDDSDSEMKPTASIGSLSGSVLDTLATYFRAHHGKNDHKAMLDAIEPTESPGSLTCCICSDDFDAGDTVACSGDDIHFFCKPCLSNYCTLTLESGPIQSITCAIPDCNALFATPDIKSVLSEYDILRIEHREDSRDRRVAMSAKAMLHCECGVVAIVTEEDMGDGRITCPGSGCGRRFCAKCGNEDHGKESCPPPAETVQWLDKHSKQCPNCSNRIEKNGGCDHMTCRPPGGCGYEFWWTCGCRYPGPHKCR